MITSWNAAAVLGAALLLGACTETGSTESTGSAAPMAASANGPPFVETMDGSVSDAAVNACAALLESQTSGGVTVVGSEFSEAATAVYMRVGENGAPWRCLVSEDGTNPTTMFMGSEGAA